MLICHLFRTQAVAHESEVNLLATLGNNMTQTHLLVHAGKLIQSMDAWTGSPWDDPSYRALALLCGLWTPPMQSTEMTMLSWSLLKAEDNSELDEHAPGTLLNRARAWIRDRFAATLAKFDDSSLKAMKEEFPWRCQRFTITGRCRVSYVERVPFG